MRILLLFLLITFLTNCTTVEIAKEVTKATKSIKTTVDNIIKDSDNKNQEVVSSEISINKQTIDMDKENLKNEKKEKEKIIKEQKQEAKINFLEKTYSEIKLKIGKPQLIRIDGNSQTIRYDNNFCQLFLFSNAKTKNAKIKYYEIRNKEGNLIINKEKIKQCYKNFNLV